MFLLNTRGRRKRLQVRTMYPIQRRGKTIAYYGEGWVLRCVSCSVLTSRRLQKWFATSSPWTASNLLPNHSFTFIKSQTFLGMKLQVIRSVENAESERNESRFYHSFLVSAASWYPDSVTSSVQSKLWQHFVHLSSICKNFQVWCTMSVHPQKCLPVELKYDPARQSAQAGAPADIGRRRKRGFGVEQDAWSGFMKTAFCIHSFTMVKSNCPRPSLI
jgi:hypothetical protein